MDEFSKDNLLDLLALGEDLTEEQTNAVCALSADQDAETRSMVAELLCNTPFPSAEETLLQLCKDPDGMVRTNACDSLCGSSNPDIMTHLLKVAECDPECLVRGYAMMSYWDIYENINGDLGRESQLSWMQELYSRETDQWVQTIYLKYLYLCSDQDAWHKILDNLKDEDYHIRNLAANAFIELTTPENIEEIQKAANAALETETAICVREKLERMSC